MLETIGHQLDLGIYPKVKSGGVLSPGDAPTHQPRSGEKVTENEARRQGRSETGTWKGPPRGKGETDGCGSANTAPSFIGSDLQMIYEDELDAITKAYPGTRVWRQPDGLWLMTESSLLPGQQQKALFLTGIPFSRTHIVQSWGFWVGGALHHPIWIGPRHTNFPHGSICAFDQNDDAWSPGDPIILLLALYTLWAFRHLHLQKLGRWPGRQVAHLPYERITEFMDDEFCGCDQSDNLYRNCCQESDMKKNLFSEYQNFVYKFGGISRCPPKCVIDFVRNQKGVPKLVDLLPKRVPFRKRFLFRRDMINMQWLGRFYELWS